MKPLDSKTVRNFNNSVMKHAKEIRRMLKNKKQKVSAKIIYYT